MTSPDSEPLPTEAADAPGETAPVAPPPSEEHWRLFIAIDLPEGIRAAVADLQGRLRKAFQFTSCAPSWVAPETMHLTLRFLGDVPAAWVPLLADAVRPLAAAAEAPRMRAMGLGVFPDWKRPRVLWTGVRDKNDRLLPLQREVENAVRSLGFEGEPQAYRPHLTLARFRRLKGTHAVKDIARSHDGFRTELFVPPCILLMRSQLGDGGARHSVVAEMPFAAASPPGPPSDAA